VSVSSGTFNSGSQRRLARVSTCTAHGGFVIEVLASWSLGGVTICSLLAGNEALNAGIEVVGRTGGLSGPWSKQDSAAPSCAWPSAAGCVRHAQTQKPKASTGRLSQPGWIRLRDLGLSKMYGIVGTLLGDGACRREKSTLDCLQGTSGDE
jgi:hypothetical protein